MGMPRATENAIAFYNAILPGDADVSTKKMFGNLAGFANGHMFTGVFGDSVFVRLGETDRATLLAEDGAVQFEPMEGKPMREYVVLPAAWCDATSNALPWIEKSLTFVRALPTKEKKEKKPKKANG